MVRYTRSERLKYQLDRLGYTHQELADAIGYSRPYVAAMLTGRPSYRCLRAAEEQVERWERKDGAVRRYGGLWPLSCR